MIVSVRTTPRAIHATIMILWMVAAGSWLRAVTETYLFQHYSVREGMVQDQAVAAYQDPSGYVWLGTFGGLSRYDGTSFRNYSLNDGLPSSTIHTIFQDGSGRIWVGTPNGAAFLENQNFVPFSFRSLKSQPSVYAILEVAGQGLFFATRQGLIRLRNGEERLFTQRDGLLDSVVQCLALAPPETVWIGTSSGLNRYRQGKIDAFPGASLKNGDEIRNIFVHPATGDAYLTRSDRVTIIHPSLASEDALPDPQRKTILWDAVLDATGKLWVASVDGLFVRDNGGEFHRLTREAGLSSAWIYKLLLDYEDNLWICSGGGVDKLSDRSLSLLTMSEGLAAKSVWGVIPWGDRLVLGTENGFQILGKQGLEKRIYLAGRTIMDAVPIGPEQLLVATDRGLYTVGNGREIPAARDVELMAADVFRLHLLSDGAWLVGTSRGLYVGRVPGIAPLTLADLNSSRSVYDILQLDADTYWLATDKGICTLRRSAESWRLDPVVLLKDVEIQCFATYRAGEVIIGTIGFGLFRWNGRDLAPMRVTAPDFSQNIWSLLVDRAGSLWVGTSRGITCLVAGQAYQFNAIHGLPNDEITSRRSLYQDGEGNYYFGTNNGLIRYRPGTIVQAPPPRVELTELRVNQRAESRLAGPLRLGSNDSLTVRFKCLSFINEKSNRYRFRLVGVDSRWSEPTPDDHVFYPILPPGEMRFELRAINSRGVESIAPLALPIEVKPPFFRTVWFFLLVGCGILVLAAAFAGYKVHLDRREKEKLRTLVREKTLELQASEENHRQLVEESLIGIAIVQEGKFVFVNPEILRTFNKKQEQIIGMPVEDCVFPEDVGLLKHDVALREKGDKSPREFELRITSGDQSVKTLLTHTAVTSFNGRPAVLINFADVTESKRMTEQLFHYQQWESIGNLAGGIAHDFNNVLQGIAGRTARIRLQLEPEAAVKADLAVIDEAVGRASALTKKLLGFAGKGKYVLVILDIDALIESAIALCRKNIPPNITFIHRPGPERIWVQGDRSQMEQVFLNLFLNSRDAMPRGGAVTIAAGLTQFETDQDRGSHLIRRGTYAEILVEDTGCGIPADLMSRVFDPFFTTKPKGLSSGLGLAAVYGIVKSHFGFIYIESEEGRGTRVKVLLPVSSAEGIG